MIRTFPCSAGSGGDKSTHYNINILIPTTFHPLAIIRIALPYPAVFSFPPFMRDTNDRYIFRILVTTFSKNSNHRAYCSAHRIPYSRRNNYTTTNLNTMTKDVGREGDRMLMAVMCFHFSCDPLFRPTPVVRQTSSWQGAVVETDSVAVAKKDNVVDLHSSCDRFMWNAGYFFFNVVGA
jgi:hypothetical protein